MMQSAVAHKYARALFDVALEEGDAETAASELDSISRLREEDPTFLEFLVSPEVQLDQKRRFIDAVFKPRVSPLVVSLLHLLGEKGRINVLPEVCEQYRRLMEEHQGRVRAQVQTAVALSGDQEGRLKKELDRITGKDVIVEKQVNPSLLGGVVVYVGNKVIDRSLQHGLKEMREALLKAGSL
jgi:F-type H+-transporting ATPase subunit delta